MKVTISKRCFKIDKTNAKAMIEGYLKEGKRIRQAIWCDVAKKPFPMLVTLNRRPTKFKQSQLGEALKPETFFMPYKFVALLDSEYPIKNDMRFWKIICNNSLFDIWTPDAPYTRFAQAKSDAAKFRICLLRLYEMEEAISVGEILPASDRIDHLSLGAREVTLLRPLINDEEFGKIKKLLIESIDKARS